MLGFHSDTDVSIIIINLRTVFCREGYVVWVMCYCACHRSRRLGGRRWRDGRSYAISGCAMTGGSSLVVSSLRKSVRVRRNLEPVRSESTMYEFGDGCSAWIVPGLHVLLMGFLMNTRCPLSVCLFVPWCYSGRMLSFVGR